MSAPTDWRAPEDVEDVDADDPAIEDGDLEEVGSPPPPLAQPGVEDDDGSDADGTTPEGLPDGLLSDDWSSPAGGAAATWRDVPIAFVDAYKPTLPSRTLVACDVTAVAYTRESSEDQTENSQPRQIGNIKSYAKRTGLRVKTFYSDLGVSGTSLHNRFRFQEMMEAARRREFKKVIVEHLDRFGRSLPIVLDAWEELRDLGIELHDAKTGKLDLAHVVIMGYLGVEGRVRFLDLCKGGKRNAVAKGLVMHAPSYGYRKHPSRKGVHLVVADRAEVVRLIFRWVLAGVGSKRIADELTARGTLSPRQCQRRDAGEVPDERSLPWDAIEVRNIVRNPIYAGWNIWGRTTPRRDRKTRRILAHDVRPREDWVVSRVPSLAVVSEELQAGAMASMRRRSFGGASSANRAGTRLLAGCMTCASCGWPMHVAVTNDRHHVYHCSDHRSSRLDRCPVASTVRLEWVERLVVAHVAARVGDLADEAAYRDRFRAAFEEGDAARRRRVAEIDRASTRIRDDLKASYIAMTRRTGVPEDVIAEVNAGLQARIDQLAAIRAGLVAVPTPAMAFEGLDTLAGGLASMAASIPFRPEDPEGEALAQRFRRLVGRILVHPRAEGVVKLELRPDRDRVTAPRGFRAEALADARVLLVDVDAEHRRESEGRFATAYAETLAAAQAGVHKLTDAAWRIAEPLLRDVDLAFEGVAFDPRTLLEGTLLLLKTKGALSRVPERYGDPETFHKALKRVIYADAWDAVVAALRKELPSVLLGAELERLDTTSYQRGPGRRRVGKLPHWDAKEKARRLAEVRAALSTQTDPVTRRRLDVVALRLGGMSSKAAADALGAEIKYVYTVYSEYRLAGLAGLLGARADGVARRVPKYEPKLLSEHDRVRLREIVDREVAAGRPPTFKALLALCAEELKVACERQCLRRALRGMGIDLPSLGGRERGAGHPDPTPRSKPARNAPTPPPPDARRRRGGERHARRFGPDAPPPGGAV